MSHWSVNYIGIPYVDGGREKDGLDCWGLLRIVYRDHKGITLPMLPNITKETILTISREIVGQIAADWSELIKPEELCGVAMSLREEPHHVGIWTEADGGKVIHAWNGKFVVAETLRSLRLRGIRTIKFYRHGIHC